MSSFYIIRILSFVKALRPSRDIQGREAAGLLDECSNITYP